MFLHIDMNSYFASVEQQANPFLRGKPIGITGKQQERSIIATASLEAKRLGVKTAMSTWQAKRTCPSIILYPGDPEKYADITKRFNRIYHEFTDQVEPFSVDESFLDLSEQAEDYLEAACIALRIRGRLEEELGEHITASIGIAPNKLMAKLSSEVVKPNGLTVTPPDRVLELLDRVDLRDLCGIGPRIEMRLHALGITTFAQLRMYPLEELAREFKSFGFWLHEAAWGRDAHNPPVNTPRTHAVPKYSPSEHSHRVIARRPKADEAISTSFCEYSPKERSSKYSPSEHQRVEGRKTNDITPDTDTEYPQLPKSYGHSYTLARDTDDPVEMQRCLLGLCDKVAWRMRRDTCTARCIATYIRYNDFTGHGQRFTLNQPTANGLTLFKTAWRMIEQWRDPMKPVRLLGISASMLLAADEPQSLFKKERRLHRLQHSLDTLQLRYGSGVWTRASLIHVAFKARSSGFHFDHEL